MSIQLDSRTPLSSLVHGFIRCAYSLVSSRLYSLQFEPVSPYTRQEFKDECDINVIMRRYQSTGELPHLNLGNAQYLDVSASLQFQDSMNYVAEAQSMFNELPSAIRDRFYNDPAQFLDFCSNEANRVELANMGLLSPEATQAALYPPTLDTPTGATLKSPQTASKPSESISTDSAT